MRRGPWSRYPPIGPPDPPEVTAAPRARAWMDAGLGPWEVGETPGQVGLFDEPALAEYAICVRGLGFHGEPAAEVEPVAERRSEVTVAAWPRPRREGEQAPGLTRTRRPPSNVPASEPKTWAQDVLRQAVETTRAHVAAEATHWEAQEARARFAARQAVVARLAAEEHEARRQQAIAAEEDARAHDRWLAARWRAQQEELEAQWRGSAQDRACAAWGRTWTAAQRDPAVVVWATDPARCLEFVFAVVQIERYHRRVRLQWVEPPPGVTRVILVDDLPALEGFFAQGWVLDRADPVYQEPVPFQDV